MEYRIDCAEIDSRQEFHRVLEKELAFPDWYGRNLDALYDMLTAISENTRLILENWNADAPFSRCFRRVLEDAEAKNPHLFVIFL